MENSPIIDNDDDNTLNLSLINELLNEVNKEADKAIAQLSGSNTIISSNDPADTLTNTQLELIDNIIDKEEENNNKLSLILNNNDDNKLEYPIKKEEELAEKVSMKDINTENIDNFRFEFLLRNFIATKQETFLLRKEIEELKIKNLSKELNVTEQALKEVYNRKKLRTTKPGAAFIPLLNEEMIDAIKKMGTIKGAARYLGVSYQTFKRYAKLYGIWIPNYNKREDKLKKSYAPPLLKDRIDEGTYAGHISAADYIQKLIETNSKEAKCEECGYDKKREVDNKIPLIIMFKDMNYKNFKLENIKFVCYNCAYQLGLIKYNTYQGSGRLMFNANIINNKDSTTYQPSEELPENLKDLNNNQNITVSQIININS